MLFPGKALGLELCQNGARFALVSGKGNQPRLEEYRTASFPADVVKYNLREANSIRVYLPPLSGKATCNF